MSAACRGCLYLGDVCPACDRAAEDRADAHRNDSGEVETGMDRDYHHPREFGAALARGGW